MKTSMAVALLVLVLAHVGLSVRFSDVGSVVVHADVSSAAATCASDCRVGYAPARPLIYFWWKNTTLEQCCSLCSANKTCAFAIHSTEHNGGCWPAPNTANAFGPHPTDTTCRTADAPAWPQPPAPSPPSPAPSPSAQVNVWPAPRGVVSAGHGSAALSPVFEVTCTCTSAPAWHSTLQWYEARIRASAVAHAPQAATPTDAEAPTVPATTPRENAAAAVPVAAGVHVEIKAAEQEIMVGPGMREGYTLNCTMNSSAWCTIKAQEAVGALRGLETLAHLAHAGPLPVPLFIADSPRYPYRGLLIDSARRFLNTATLKRVLDGMCIAKLNVLHWHLSDTTAFPVKSDLYPQLAERGAYHPRATYSKDDLRAIVAYARQRGIRVIPEFDMPGHSSFGKGMPEITIPECGGALDPTNEGTYAFLTRFLGEMGTLFPEPYLALGGDEVSFGCAAGPRKQWLQQHNMTAAQLLPYFWRRLTADVLPHLNRTLYVWGTTDLSNLDPASVPPGTVFNLYTRLDANLNVTAQRGVPGVLSAPYYLDQTQSYRMGPGRDAGAAVNGGSGAPASTRATLATGVGMGDGPAVPRGAPTSNAGCGTAVRHINDIWSCFYSSSPSDGVPPALAANTSLVLGGEACIWGEGTSAMSIDSQTMTPASAVAERLWTGEAVGDARAAFNHASTAAAVSTRDRLAAHVCLMNTIGIDAVPIDPGFCLADL